jgi:hypothetical protein
METLMIKIYYILKINNITIIYSMSNELMMYIMLFIYILVYLINYSITNINTKEKFNDNDEINIDYYRLSVKKIRNIDLPDNEYEIMKYYNNDKNNNDKNNNEVLPTKPDVINMCKYNDKKYKLSIIAIFKNEGMNLKTWIEHYIWQGVEHFYLINNDSDDNFMDILKPYMDLITLYNIPFKHIQAEAYKFVYKNEDLQNKTEYLIMADLDEFWYCYNSNIKNELKKYPEYDIIYSKWRMFGTPSIKHPEDIRLDSVNRDNGLHILTKWICKTKNIDYSNIWIHNINNYEPKKLNIIDLSDIFRLNHYPIQSLEYFVKIKMTRGDVASQNSDNVRDINYFMKYNENKDLEDNDLKNMILVKDNGMLYKFLRLFN